MNTIIVKNKEEAAEKAFEIVNARLEAGAISTFGFATGSTPEGLYAKMRAAKPDVSNIVTVNLDENEGLAEDDLQSYNYFMQQKPSIMQNFKETNLPNGIQRGI